MPTLYQPKPNPFLGPITPGGASSDLMGMAGPMASPFALGMTAARGWLRPGKGLQELTGSELHGGVRRVADMFRKGLVRKAGQGTYQGPLTDTALQEIERDVLENATSLGPRGNVVLEGFPATRSNYLSVPMEDIFSQGLAEAVRRRGIR